ncbi:MAG: hypothetical protein LBV67_00025 [Streptococcaceae bacterium]|jgi:hypothetical protein|nr:hypothetical protein [Streptococcaceae bacterium]
MWYENQYSGPDGGLYTGAGGGLSTRPGGGPYSDPGGGAYSGPDGEDGYKNNIPPWHILVVEPEKRGYKAQANLIRRHIKV